MALGQNYQIDRKVQEPVQQTEEGYEGAQKAYQVLSYRDCTVREVDESIERICRAGGCKGDEEGWEERGVKVHLF